MDIQKKTTIIDGRGEHPSKMIDILITVSEICQIHETVFIIYIISK